MSSKYFFRLMYKSFLLQMFSFSSSLLHIFRVVLENVPDSSFEKFFELKIRLYPSFSSSGSLLRKTLEFFAFFKEKSLPDRSELMVFWCFRLVHTKFASFLLSVCIHHGRFLINLTISPELFPWPT